MLAILRSQSQVLARVVADLVDVARQDIDHLAMTPIEVEAFVQSAVAQVPELAQFSVRIDAAGSMVFLADSDRMLQVVTNYLSNAAKYGSSRVEIAAFEDSGDAVIEVHDDGPGVPEVFHMVIWERFERGPQRQSAIPGSGIGLSVARGVARSHGGDTHYRRSERLGGSCFSVRIPVLRSGAEPSWPVDLTITA